MFISLTLMFSSIIGSGLLWILNICRRSFWNSPKNFCKCTFWMSPGAGQCPKSTKTQQNKVRKKMIQICVIEWIYFSPAYCIKRKFSKGITKACGLLDLPKINYHRTETCLLKNVNHIILILSFKEHALHFLLSFAI